MEGKKKLKKLLLKKEEIVNLNEYQMKQIQGGSTYWCIAETVIGSIATAIEGYQFGKEESWWNCPESQQENCMGDISKYFMTGGCLIPDVDIYGW